MNRRKAMKVAAGAIAGSGAGLLTLTNAFKPKINFDNEPHELDNQPEESDWKYLQLDPKTTAELAYKFYPEGSCMYATIKSIVSQLANNEIFTNAYKSNVYNNKLANTCLTCHSSEGKVNNVAVKMDCTRAIQNQRDIGSLAIYITN